MKKGPLTGGRISGSINTSAPARKGRMKRNNKPTTGERKEID